MCIFNNNNNLRREKVDLPHHMVIQLDVYLVYTAKMEGIQGCMLYLAGDIEICDRICENRT